MKCDLHPALFSNRLPNGYAPFRVLITLKIKKLKNKNSQHALKN